MKMRNMTIKGFMHKSNSVKVSASAFLDAHREWLLSGELSPITTPIFVKLDNNEILPSPALDTIKGAVLGHIAAKAEESLIAKEEKSSSKTSKPWIATIYDATGEVQIRTLDNGNEEVLQKGFNSSSEADGWSDRRLVDGASDWFAVVAHTSIMVGIEPLSTIIKRDDAMARLFKSKGGPVMKGQSRSAGSLTFGVKVRNDRAVFSRG